MTAPKILFFDVNESLLDLEGIKKSVAKSLAGREELTSLWFSTMLHYSLVETTSGRFTDFGTIGAAALRMLASGHDIDLTEEEASEAVKPILSLLPHPEVKEALGNLRTAGYKMVALTNSSSKGVETQLRNAQLTSFFDAILSVEEVGKYKPHTDVYNWAAHKMGVHPSECMMIAAHGWDIAGAIWAGWRGAFIARPGKQLYPLAPLPEINETDLLKIAQKLMDYK
jgi:2-haloacid dehalogenase